jgi:hypothetical protein
MVWMMLTVVTVPWLMLLIAMAVTVMLVLVSIQFQPKFADKFEKGHIENL